MVKSKILMFLKKIFLIFFIFFSLILITNTIGKTFNKNTSKTQIINKKLNIIEKWIKKSLDYLDINKKLNITLNLITSKSNLDINKAKKKYEYKDEDFEKLKKFNFNKNILNKFTKSLSQKWYFINFKNNLIFKKKEYKFKGVGFLKTFNTWKDFITKNLKNKNDIEFLTTLYNKNIKKLIESRWLEKLSISFGREFNKKNKIFLKTLFINLSNINNFYYINPLLLKVEKISNLKEEVDYKNDYRKISFLVNFSYKGITIDNKINFLTFFDLKFNLKTLKNNDFLINNNEPKSLELKNIFSLSKSFISNFISKIYNDSLTFENKNTKSNLNKFFKLLKEKLFSSKYKDDQKVNYLMNYFEFFNNNREKIKNDYLKLYKWYKNNSNDFYKFFKLFKELFPKVFKKFNWSWYNLNKQQFIRLNQIIKHEKSFYKKNQDELKEKKNKLKNFLTKNLTNDLKNFLTEKEIYNQPSNKNLITSKIKNLTIKTSSDGQNYNDIEFDGGSNYHYYMFFFKKNKFLYYLYDGWFGNEHKFFIFKEKQGNIEKYLEINENLPKNILNNIKKNYQKNITKLENEIKKLENKNDYYTLEELKNLEKNIKKLKKILFYKKNIKKLKKILFNKKKILFNKKDEKKEKELELKEKKLKLYELFKNLEKSDYIKNIKDKELIDDTTLPQFNTFKLNYVNKNGESWFGNKLYFSISQYNFLGILQNNSLLNLYFETTGIQKVVKYLKNIMNLFTNKNQINYFYTLNEFKKNIIKIIEILFNEESNTVIETTIPFYEHLSNIFIILFKKIFTMINNLSFFTTLILNDKKINTSKDLTNLKLNEIKSKLKLFYNNYSIFDEFNNNYEKDKRVLHSLFKNNLNINKSLKYINNNFFNLIWNSVIKKNIYILINIKNNSKNIVNDKLLINNFSNLIFSIYKLLYSFNNIDLTKRKIIEVISSFFIFFNGEVNIKFLIKKIIAYSKKLNFILTKGDIVNFNKIYNNENFISNKFELKYKNKESSWFINDTKIKKIFKLNNFYFKIFSEYKDNKKIWYLQNIYKPEEKKELNINKKFNISFENSNQNIKVYCDKVDKANFKWSFYKNENKSDYVELIQSQYLVLKEDKWYIKNKFNFKNSTLLKNKKFKINNMYFELKKENSKWFLINVIFGKKIDLKDYTEIYFDFESIYILNHKTSFFDKFNIKKLNFLYFGGGVFEKIINKILNVFSFISWKI